MQRVFVIITSLSILYSSNSYVCSYSGNKEEIKEKGFQISEICIGIEQERYKFVGDRHPLRLVWSVIIIWGPRGATSERGFINSARMTLGVTRNTFP